MYHVKTDLMITDPGAGGRFSLQLSEDGSSMSVLIPGEEPLRYYRQCKEEHYYYNLVTWFGFAELYAWERVNTYFIVLEAHAGVPGVMKGSALLGHEFHGAQAFLGFDNVKARGADDEHYTLFLQVYSSGPCRRFKTNTLKSRLKEMFG